MTLTKYIEDLQKLEAAGHGKLKMLYSSDAEGNSFSYVSWSPSLGYFDGYSFTPKDQFKECEIEEAANSICVN